MPTNDFLTSLPIGSCRTYGADGEVTVRATVPSPMYERAARLPPVSTQMTRNVECVKADLALDSLIALLVERNISAVPVVDDRGHPIGVASKTDVVRWTYEHDPAAIEIAASDVIEPGSSVRAIPTATVHDVMMPIAFVLPEDSPISFAAALMATEGIHHIPVISNENQIVGIVSSLDLVGWMAAQEGYAVARR